MRPFGKSERLRMPGRARHNHSTRSQSPRLETLPTTFEKLNLKDQRHILVLNAPESFELEMSGLRGVTIWRDLPKADRVGFSLAFVTKQDEVDAITPKVAKKAEGDAAIWFAYPKGTSKKYKSEINRDRGWKVLGRFGFEPVRAVSIDDDWSALRFRRVEFIKSLTRDRAHTLSAAGRARSKQKQ